jgi:hypothetical protein
LDETKEELRRCFAVIVRVKKLEQNRQGFIELAQVGRELSRQLADIASRQI